jgi:hypothetical protein
LSEGKRLPVEIYFQSSLRLTCSTGRGQRERRLAAMNKVGSKLLLFDFTDPKQKYLTSVYLL